MASTKAIGRLTTGKVISCGDIQQLQQQQPIGVSLSLRFSFSLPPFLPFPHEVIGVKGRQQPAAVSASPFTPAHLPRPLHSTPRPVLLISLVLFVLFLVRLIFFLVILISFALVDLFLRRFLYVIPISSSSSSDSSFFPFHFLGRIVHVDDKYQSSKIDAKIKNSV